MGRVGVDRVVFVAAQPGHVVLVDYLAPAMSV